MILYVQMNMIIILAITWAGLFSKTAAEDQDVLQRLGSLEKNVEKLVTLVQSSTRGVQQVTTHLAELEQVSLIT